MKWALISFFESILESFKVLFATIACNFIGCININVGAKLPTIGEPKRNLADALGSIGSGDGLFDRIFAGVGAFCPAFVLLGVVIVFFLGIFELYNSMMAPLDRAEPPLRIGIKMGLCTAAVFFAYDIFIMFEYTAQKIYMKFQETAFSKEVTGAEGGVGKIDSPEWKVMNKAEDIANSVWDADIVSGFLADAEVTLAGLLICTIAIILILANFFKLILEAVERYAVLGLLFYSAPVAFSALTVERTKDIFSSWVRMVVSQFILMMSSCFFIMTFIGALERFSRLGAGVHEADSGSFAMYVVYNLLLLAWLKVGQNVDGYLKGMGLSAAQCGGGLASSVAAFAGSFAGGALRSAGTRAARSAGAKILGRPQPAGAGPSPKKSAAERNRQFGGEGGRAAAAKDFAEKAKKDANGKTKKDVFGSAADASALEKSIRNATAKDKGVTVLDHNDGGKSAIGEAGSLGKGAKDLGNGYEAKVINPSAQANEAVSMAMGGTAAAKAESERIAKSIGGEAGTSVSTPYTSRSGVSSYITAGAGDFGETRTFATASGVNDVHPVHRAMSGKGFDSGGAVSLEKKSFDMKDISGDGFSMQGRSVPVVKGSGVFIEDVSGAAVTKISGSYGIGARPSFNASEILEGGDGYAVAGGNITSDGLDYLRSLEEEAREKGQMPPWKAETFEGAGDISVFSDTPDSPAARIMAREDIRDKVDELLEASERNTAAGGIVMNEETFLHMKENGMIGKIDEGEFADGAFRPPSGGGSFEL